MATFDPSTVKFVQVNAVLCGILQAWRWLSSSEQSSQAARSLPPSTCNTEKLHSQNHLFACFYNKVEVYPNVHGRPATTPASPTSSHPPEDNSKKLTPGSEQPSTAKTTASADKPKTNQLMHHRPHDLVNQANHLMSWSWWTCDSDKRTLE